MLFLLFLATVAGFVALVVALARTACRLMRSPKEKKLWWRCGQLAVLCLLVAMFFAPNSVRIQIAEMRLWPLLAEGRSLEAVTKGLDRRWIKYTLTAHIPCHGNNPDLDRCGDIRKIHIRQPVLLSFIEGEVHIDIYFDRQNKLKEYEARTSWTFI